MKPYYDDGNGIQIYHGDCREILPTLEPVDLVLTDPPYGIDLEQHQIRNRQGLGLTHAGMRGDSEPMDLRWLWTMPCEVVAFGAENFPDQLPHRGRWICWDKRCHERADYILGSPFELAWRNIHRGYYKMIRVQHAGFINDDGPGRRWHPTQKPVRLMVKILQLYPKATTIFDSFMGSGTTLVAAKELHRKAIGCEIEEKYCEIAANRLAQGVLPYGGVKA